MAHAREVKMRFRFTVRLLILSGILMSAALPVMAQSAARTAQNRVRISGTVRDDKNAITLPGVPVQIAGTEQTVFTDVDGRFILDVAPGEYELQVTVDTYEPRTIKVVTGTERNIRADIGLVMSRFSETVTVTATAVDVSTSTAEAQLVSRRQAPVITDNMGSSEMRLNGDSDAASAMSRVTGLSLVDNQYVFVRGLGERYSNTTLSGSVLPTTEPDKKVVPLDLFPAGLIDSVQVAKTYSPDKSAEFAGGLVQIVPLKLPSRPVVDLSYGYGYSSTATGKNIPLSSLGSRDWVGFDGGERALPSAFPDSKIVRQGIYTPDVGFNANEITQFGRLLDNQWRPRSAKGKPGQNWSLAFGNRFGKLGVVASAMQSYRELYVAEDRRFFRVADDSELEAVSDYKMQSGTQRAQLGVVGNLSYQFSPNHRLSVENFYSHSGRDEGRTFEGPNTENNFLYRNYRLQFIEEGLMANAVSGDHFFQGLGNSRLDWRVNVARAKRDEPDLREVLYQSPEAPAAQNLVLADESQSGFRMFSNLKDRTSDFAANWSVLRSATQLKFGASFVDRTRDFSSRRFRFIPVTLTKDGPSLFNPSLAPEELYTNANVGTAFRFNEETRPVDAYDGNYTTTSVYGMVDTAITSSSRLIAGARVERFKQEVNTFDPFGLFVRKISASNNNTDIFPGVNLVQSLGPNMNLRAGYSATVNRPEFRELAEFEFTDVVGSRAVRGNPNLRRALIQNVDTRWEMFLGARGILAASGFFKYFDQPIERVVIGGAQPLVTFQNSDHARNFGLELEAGHGITNHFFVSANYTFVDSKIALLPEQQTVQTSLERPLAGQSKNIVNLTAEVLAGGFSTRLLFNYFGDRISDVGSNDAPDVVEQGRNTLDLVFSQRVRKMNFRLNLENLTDARYRFTQGTEVQRAFKAGRMATVSLGLNVF
jgi:hypothetical protein